MRAGLAKPVPAKLAIPRNWDPRRGRKYELKIGQTWYRVLYGATHTGHLYFECRASDLQTVYRFIRQFEEAQPKSEKREIIRPILPRRIIKLIEETVFDFFKAMDELKTRNGFGNVGLIFTGPAGVGKSETMRWISRHAYHEYGRASTSLGYAELQKLLANGQPLNSDKLILMVDDIDANVLRDRRATQNPMTSQLLTCVDGLNKEEGRLIILSTNEKIDDIDPALVRPGRFDTIVHFNYPDNKLTQEFCAVREIDLDPSLFYGWSFAKVDMFLNRFKVTNHRYGTTLQAFYEKFIYENGTSDRTVDAYAMMDSYNE